MANRHDTLMLSRSLDRTLFAHLLYSGGQPPPDVLIRTSGEIRLSDFLTFQVRPLWLGTSTLDLWCDSRITRFSLLFLLSGRTSPVFTFSES